MQVLRWTAQEKTQREDDEAVNDNDARLNVPGNSALNAHNHHVAQGLNTEAVADLFLTEMVLLLHFVRKYRLAVRHGRQEQEGRERSECEAQVAEEIEIADGLFCGLLLSVTNQRSLIFFTF